VTLEETLKNHESESANLGRLLTNTNRKSLPANNNFYDEFGKKAFLQIAYTWSTQSNAIAIQAETFNEIEAVI